MQHAHSFLDWGQDRRAPLYGSSTATKWLLHASKQTQNYTQKKESQAIMLEVGFFWICQGENGVYPVLGTAACQSSGKYSATAQVRPCVLRAFAPPPLGICLLFPFLLPQDCSNPRGRWKNHIKSNRHPLCNRFLGEAQIKVSLLARNLHLLHSWAQRHFRKHKFSKLRVFLSL